MPLLLLRHAVAGQRQCWPHADGERPLTEAGERQAVALAGQLAGDAPAGIVTSAYRRCVQTVRPLAEWTGLPVTTVDWLGADVAGRPQAAALLARELRALSAVGGTVVACTHGEVMAVVLQAVVPGPVLERARHGGAPEPPGDKGGTWVLQWADGSVVEATFRPPP